MNNAIACELEAGGEPVEIDWPELLPLGAAPELPDFPVDALPPVLGEMVHEVASSIQVPEDLPAMLALATVAAAGAGRFVVPVGETFTQPVNLYVAVVMESGSRKSPAMAEMVAPLVQAEESKRQAWLAQSERICAEREMTEGLIEAKRKEAGRHASPEVRARLLDEVAQLRGSMPPEASEPRLLVDDTTVEALAVRMADSADRMAMFSAEGGIFGAMAGRYNKAGGPNLDLYLKAHDGERATVDRISRPAVVLRRPLLTMGLAVQPEILKALGREEVFRGRGLLARILWSLPGDMAGTRMFIDRPIGVGTKRRYDQLISEVLAFPDEGQELPLTPEALATWIRGHDNTEREQVAGGRLCAIKDWASKLPARVARIAGCLHLATCGDEAHGEAIGEETVAAAWQIGEYLIEHALAAFGEMALDPIERSAMKIWRWASSQGIMVAKARDLMRATSLKLDEFEPAVAALIKRGYLLIRAVPRQTRPGRPAGVEFLVRPAGL